MKAFPSEAYGNAPPHTGMTLRDYFAAKAMHSICLREDYIDAPASCIAIDAYALADAMLEVRNAAQ